MSEHDDLDRRLAEAGAAWRAQHDVPPVEVPEQRRRPGWLVPVAAAASVALLIGGATLVAGQLEDGSSDGAPVASGGSRWHPDLPAGMEPARVAGAVPPVPHEVLFPGTEAAGVYRPAVAQAAGAPTCDEGDVVLGAETGDVPGAVTLTLTAARSDVRCAVSYYPALQFLAGGGYVEVLQNHDDPRPGDWPASVLVTPDQRAVLRSTWVGWCGDTPRAETVEVILHRGALRLDSPRTGSCAAINFATDRLISTGWEPEGFTFEPSKGFDVRARLVDQVDGPGGLPTWVVELTATRGDIDLDTCPSWEVRQGEEESASWRLNCAAVPHRRADGTPYLPAGEPVRFAVWVSYGDSDAPLTWVLTTPEGLVSVDLSRGPAAPEGEPRLVEEDEANVHLWLSNQSFDDPEVRVTVAVDGTELVDEDFAVEGQHNFVDFHLALSAGRHEVVVTSDTGARIERTVRVRERGDRWMAALYWGGGSEGPTFDWMVQDQPIAWA